MTIISYKKGHFNTTTKFENKGRFFPRKDSWQLYTDVAKKKDALKPF